MSSIKQDLISAQSKLHREFGEDEELFHLALAIVYSSIFNYHSHKVIIVGGQASSYWLHIAGSTDVDFVCKDFEDIRTILIECGFSTVDNSLYRLVHPETNALIELVGETVEIEHVKSTEIVEIEPAEVDNTFVRSLMKANGFIIDPSLVFINYVSSSDHNSIWYDYNDEGSLSIERAQALWRLYPEYIQHRFIEMQKENQLELTDSLKTILKEFPQFPIH